jgi:hypothetical protein
MSAIRDVATRAITAVLGGLASATASDDWRRAGQDVTRRHRSVRVLANDVGPEMALALVATVRPVSEAPMQLARRLLLVAAGVLMRCLPGLRAAQPALSAH